MICSVINAPLKTIKSIKKPYLHGITNSKPTYPNTLLEQNNQYEVKNNDYSEKDRNTLKASEQLTLKRQYSVIIHR
jgi:hypothetical protein